MWGLDAPGLEPEGIDDERVRMVQVISLLVRLVVEHRLDENEACEVAAELAGGLARKAYRL